METRTLLVVDDSQAVREALCLLLRSRGLPVRAVGTPSEGLREARRQRPAAILVGHSPLGGGPLGFGARLRAAPELGDVPVVEVARVDEIVREIADGWDRCGSAARDLVARLRPYTGTGLLGTSPLAT